jgi:hypothetical protein
MSRARHLVIVALIAGGLAAAALGLAGARVLVASHLGRRNIPMAGSVPLPGAAALPSGWTLCTNSALGFSIGYPRNWYTTYRFPEQACRWFDPYRLRLIAETDGFLTALEAHVERGSFAEAAYENPAGERIVFREQIVVNGRQAVRFEMEPTDIELYPNGTRVYRYVIDLGEKGAFFVETRSRPGIDYTADKRVVDKVVQTLQVF